MSKTLIELKGLTKQFKVSGGTLTAVNNVNIKIEKGETLGLVGESGCGKSTLGRTIMGVYPATKGQIIYDGAPKRLVSAKDRYEYSRKAQMIFQDPYACLNPRMTVGAIIAEGMEIHKIGNSKSREAKVRELLSAVGLNPEHINRFPHEFSGGQRQRIGIARALATEPEFIVCDEPISALDVSVQSQVINLLLDLQEKLGLTYLFIAHDLNIVRYISTKIAVMYLGNIVEYGTSEEVYYNPKHPYSEALLSSVPDPDPENKDKPRNLIEGDIPSPINLPKGCNFAGRCPKATDKCREEKPELTPRGEGHFVACFNA